MQHPHWFQRASNGILVLFLGIMVVVVIIAHTRRSGTTGMDMAGIQQMRAATFASQGQR